MMYIRKEHAYLDLIDALEAQVHSYKIDVLVPPSITVV